MQNKYCINVNVYHFSKNSLDENTLDPPPNPRTFDEQEMSMEMYNDEYDNYNKTPNSQVRDSHLKAAIREHQRGGSNDLNSSNHNHSAKRNGTVNGAVRNVGYDNVGYRSGVPPHQVEDLEATEI
jgi:hypothetical protein